MRNKMIALLSVAALLFIYSTNIQAQQRRILKRKKSKPLHVVVHYGNLGGVGLGCQYRLLNNRGIDLLLK